MIKSLLRWCLAILSAIWARICMLFLLVQCSGIFVYEYFFPSKTRLEKAAAHRGLKTATTYAEWELHAERLDFLYNDLYAWKHDMSSPHYRYRALREKLEAIHEACEDDNETMMENQLRSGMRRFAGGIGKPELYGVLYSGTKYLVEGYAQTMLELLDMLVKCWERLDARERVWKIESARKTIGRTALALQGGSLFGLCHFGVIRELLAQGLLPKVIAGIGTGAIAAGLVASMDDEELEEFLEQPESVAEAFRWKESRVVGSGPDWSDRLLSESGRWFDIFASRFKDLATSELMLDQDALQHCVDTQLGDTTFEEAFKHSSREVCITIACDVPGTPNLLNYITTPNVLIRSAVRAAMISDFDKAAEAILEKNFDGEVQAWSVNDETNDYRDRRRRRDRGLRQQSLLYEDQAIDRLRQIFNVNHFIISQGRPYFIPFNQQPFSRAQAPKLFPRTKLLLRKYITRMIQLRVTQLSRLVQLPQWLQKLMMDTRLPRTNMTIVPRIGLREIEMLLRNPGRESVEHWMTVGEKSVWPCVAAIRLRCGVEFALQRHSDSLREQDPMNWFLAQRGRDL